MSRRRGGLITVTTPIDSYQTVKSTFWIRVPQRGGELFVEGEEVFDAGRWGTVRAGNSAPRRGHRQRVGQIGQRRGRLLRPHVQHRLRRGFYCRTLTIQKPSTHLTEGTTQHFIGRPMHKPIP